MMFHFLVLQFHLKKLAERKKENDTFLKEKAEEN